MVAHTRGLKRGVPIMAEHICIHYNTMAEEARWPSCRASDS